MEKLLEGLVRLSDKPLDFTEYKKDKEELPYNYYGSSLKSAVKIGDIEFTIEEIQQFLIDRRYKLAIINSYANISHYIDEGVESRQTHTTREIRKRPIAIKTLDTVIKRNILPLYMDAKEIDYFDLISVAKMELKGKILQLKNKV